MTESYEDISENILSIPRDVILEIGPGYSPGATAYDQIPSLLERIQNGALYIAVDQSHANLQHITQGAVMHNSLTDLSRVHTFDGKVQTLFMSNVFGESNSGVAHEFAAKKVLPTLSRMLAPGGVLIIIEHLTPRHAEFLKDVVYEPYDLVPQVYTGDRLMPAMARWGFSDERAQAVSIAATDRKKPFMIVLRKKETEDMQ